MPLTFSFQKKTKQMSSKKTFNFTKFTGVLKQSLCTGATSQTNALAEKLKEDEVSVKL